MNRSLYIIVFLVLPFGTMFAQTKHFQEPHKVEYKNVIALFAGNTIIAPSGFNLPTIGVEYAREINHIIGIGLIAEVEIGSHIVQVDEEGEMSSEMHRSGAFLVLPSVFFRVYKGLILSAGYGVEFEDKENLSLLKLGLAYKLTLENPRWAVLPSVSWDHTKHFEGFVYGINFAYKF